MAAAKREELKRRVEKNLDDLLAPLFSLLRNAPRFRFLSKQTDDVAQEAFKSLLTQIDKGNLDWVLDKPDPDATIKCLLLTTFLKDAVTKIARQSRDRRSHNFLEIVDAILPDDDAGARERRLDDQVDLEPLIAGLPEPFRQIVSWALAEGRLYCRRLLTLVREIAQLPEEQQSILYSFYIEEKSHQETAAEFGVSPAAIKQKLYRIKSELRRRLLHPKTV